MFDNPFLLTALFAGLAASITSGIMGAYVVSRRILFIAGSISHSVLGGIGFFIWLKRVHGIEWLTPVSGALCAALLSAILIAWVRSRFRERMDTVISMIWSTGMALGVIFISLTPGYNLELLDFLFGNILWVSQDELKTLFILDAGLLAVVMLMHKRFVAICFDEEHARLQGQRVDALYVLLLCLVAVSIVILLQVVGAILVIAMLTIPAALAGTFSYRLSRIMALATLIGVACTLTGTAASYMLDWPPGATISLCATALYASRLIIKQLERRKH